MTKSVKVRSVRDSDVITLPKPVLSQLDWYEGESVYLVTLARGILVVVPDPIEGDMIDELIKIVRS